MSLDSKKRVKVYKMVDSVWDDQGTGYVEFSMLEVYLLNFIYEVLLMSNDFHHFFALISNTSLAF